MAALHGQRITLTELGRALPSQARVKHNIKRVDRLLGNVQLCAERFGIYQAIARWLLGQARQPIIVVDWSDLTADRSWQLLRAAVVLGGRTLTLYEEVHPLRHFANRRVHRVFLRQLATLLPTGTTPILITDAGFRAPWFKAVSSLGWHWIGRVRHLDYVRAQGSPTWVGCKSLYVNANARAQALGGYEIVRSNSVCCSLYLVKRAKKNRVNKSVFGKRVRSSQSLKQARAQREPWLLAASPSLAAFPATDIVNFYTMRMQIEEAFRDLKSDRYGLGFELNLSRTRERIATLLLIAALALFVLWHIGRAAINQGLQFQYQSNTRRNRPVISVLYLACLLLRHPTYASPPRVFSMPLPLRYGSLPVATFNPV
ncbi:MAG: IS4 family transposase [Betaproteobacteria bacterium]